jgi:hypothetical protein
MQAGEAINLAERVLRDLVREVLGDAWQSDAAVDREKLPSSTAHDPVLLARPARAAEVIRPSPALVN